MDHRSRLRNVHVGEFSSHFGELRLFSSGLLSSRLMLAAYRSRDDLVNTLLKLRVVSSLSE